MNNNTKTDVKLIKNKEIIIPEFMNTMKKRQHNEIFTLNL